MVALFIGACDNGTAQTETTETQAKTPAHQASPELEKKIVDDAMQDLKAIAAAGQDTNSLAQALTGKALDETKAVMAQDLAQGKYRKRDYQNINVRLQDYAAPVAQVFAEFDDKGYYVDAASGAALTEPANERKTYALALIEEGGRWKIKGIYAAEATTTATTPATPQ